VELHQITDAEVVTPTTHPSIGRDALAMLRILTLAGAAGAWAGLLAGGIGGRIAMFVLRVTSDSSVRGIESDDGFTIGQVSTATLFLLLVTTVFGAVAGLLYAPGRHALPAAWRVPAMTALGATVGGAALLKPYTIDFVRLEPHWLACALFIAIPGGAGLLLAWFTERFDQWWWIDSRRTVLVALPLPLLLLAVPVVPAIMAAVGAVTVLGQISPLRRAVRRWGPWLVRGALALFVALGTQALLNDLRAIL